jgi:hypothetical protein
VKKAMREIAREIGGKRPIVMEWAVHVCLGWPDDGPWDEGEKKAVDYVVSRVLTGATFADAVIELVRQVDIPLGTGMRTHIAEQLTKSGDPMSKRDRTKALNYLICAFATREKKRLMQSGMSASDAEEAAAAKFGKSADAIKQQIKRNNRMFREYERKP